MENESDLLKYFDYEALPITQKEWGHLRRTKSHVGDIVIGQRRVSTVYVGLDMSSNDEDGPLIFETMIFNLEGPLCENGLDDYIQRHANEIEAIEGHKKACEMVKAYYKKKSRDGKDAEKA